jgi:hypothetical protein
MRTEAIDARRLVSSSDRQVAKLGERSRRIRKLEQACCSNRATTEGWRYQGKECVSERQVCSMGFYSVLVKPDDPYIVAGYSVGSLGCRWPDSDLPEQRQEGTSARTVLQDP